MVVRLVRDQEVAGSNPAVPTIIENDADLLGIFFFPASNFSLSIIPYHLSTKCGYNLFLEVTLWLFMR